MPKTVAAAPPLSSTPSDAESMIQAITVTTWAELEGELFDNNSWPELNRLRTRHLYRGLPDSSFCLKTTLQRLAAEDQAGGQIDRIEPLMLRQFKKYAHRDVVEKDTIWHWLSIAQHHGLATRLLDWTNSPYIALHFATDDRSQFGQDGAIWAINFIDIHKDFLPEPLAAQLEKIGVKAFAVDELNEVVNSLDMLESLSEKDYMLFFEPPSIDDRIVNQYALLSVMSRSKAVPEEWLESQDKELGRKIVIPAALKDEIRDRLDMMNMNERVFFPGLDGLSKYLNRYYGPRPCNAISGQEDIS